MEHVLHTDGKPYVSSPRYTDPTFLENLNRLDSFLEPRWNPARCKWEIWRKNKYILTVQSSKNEFQPLDNRVLYQLYKCDTRFFASSHQFIQSLHIEDDKLASGKIKEQDNFMRDCADDMAPMLRKRTSVDINPKKVYVEED